MTKIIQVNVRSNIFVKGAGDLGMRVNSDKHRNLTMEFSDIGVLVKVTVNGRNCGTIIPYANCSNIDVELLEQKSESAA